MHLYYCVESRGDFDFEKTTAEIVEIVAEKSLRKDANSTTCTAIYQPKAPASLSKFKKADKFVK
jgi:cyclic lactone autoinducer peptide